MKMWEKVMGLTLSLVLLISAFPVSTLAADAVDEVVVSEGAIEIDLGEDAYSFNDEVSLLGTAPSGMIVKDGITRAEWMKDLVLLFDMSITADEYPDIYFPDISDATAYFDEIMTAVKYGVVSIEAGDNFRAADLPRRRSTLTLVCRKSPKPILMLTQARWNTWTMRRLPLMRAGLRWLAGISSPRSRSLPTRSPRWSTAFKPYWMSGTLAMAHQIFNLPTM